MIVIDLPSHQAACLRCRTIALCPTGRRLATAQATGLLEMASLPTGKRWRREPAQ